MGRAFAELDGARDYDWLREGPPKDELAEEADAAGHHHLRALAIKPRVQMAVLPPGWMHPREEISSHLAQIHADLAAVGMVAALDSRDSVSDLVQVAGGGGGKDDGAE